MEFVLQAVTTNGCAAVLLMSLLLNYRSKHGTHDKESRLYVTMIVLNLIQCVVEPITSFIDGKIFPGNIFWATVLNASLFINTVVFALTWSQYAEVKIGPHEGRKPSYYLTYIPAALVFLGAVTNLFTPVFFRITAENVYQRIGPYFLTYLATYFYLLLGGITIFRHREQKEKSIFLPAMTFLFPVLLASVIQFFVPGISLLWSGAAIGLASAYMSLQDESAFTDQLSGLFSRHYLNYYLSSLPERVKDPKQLLGIMMDVDEFKAINDNFGHLTGDDAITAVGEILRTAIPDNRFIFRYAGDEFVLIMPVEDISEAVPVMNRIHAEAEHFNRTSGRPYRLSFSMGYTTYIPGEKSAAFIARMDEKMYENKRQNKTK